MSTISTSLSTFLIEKSNLLKIQEQLQKLKQFSDKDFAFQIQDMINSALAIMEDCFEFNKKCFEMCDGLQVLETYSKRMKKSKVALILEKYDSIQNLLQQCKSEIKHLQEKVTQCATLLKEMQNKLIESNELVCFKCEGEGESVKTKYVRERGTSPQPYIERIPCKYCDGNGKIEVDSETKKELSSFIQNAKSIHGRFDLQRKTLTNYVKEYKIPSLEGYYEIEDIFPEEKPDTKKNQKPLSTYY